MDFEGRESSALFLPISAYYDYVPSNCFRRSKRGRRRSHRFWLRTWPNQSREQNTRELVEGRIKRQIPRENLQLAKSVKRMHSHQTFSNKLLVVHGDQRAQVESAILAQLLLKPPMQFQFPNAFPLQFLPTPQSLDVPLPSANLDANFFTNSLPKHQLNNGTQSSTVHQNHLFAQSNLNISAEPKTLYWPSLLWAFLASTHLPTAGDNSSGKNLGEPGTSSLKSSAVGSQCLMNATTNLGRIKVEKRLETSPGTRSTHSGSSPTSGVAFSIADLLATANTPLAAPSKSNLNQATKYFFEELPWTDGRRIRRQLAQTGTPKKVEDAKEQQFVPPLPNEQMCSKRLGNAGHTCQQCGKSYATSSNLSRHKQTHRPLDSPFAKKCTFCDRVYVSMPALSMHLLTHQATHKCHICGKLFSRPWLLKGHLRSHTGSKPFGCGSCGKAFSDRSNLRAHLNTHNNEKRFECTQCGRLFALRSYLNKHLIDGKCQQLSNASEGYGTAVNSCRSSSALPELEDLEAGQADES